MTIQPGKRGEKDRQALKEENEEGGEVIRGWKGSTRRPARRIPKTSALGGSERKKKERLVSETLVRGTLLGKPPALRQCRALGRK